MTREADLAHSPNTDRYNAWVHLGEYLAPGSPIDTWDPFAVALNALAADPGPEAKDHQEPLMDLALSRQNSVSYKDRRVASAIITAYTHELIKNPLQKLQQTFGFTIASSIPQIEGLTCPIHQIMDLRNAPLPEDKAYFTHVVESANGHLIVRHAKGTETDPALDAVFIYDPNDPLTPLKRRGADEAKYACEMVGHLYTDRPMRLLLLFDSKIKNQVGNYLLAHFTPQNFTQTYIGRKLAAVLIELGRF